MTAKAKDLKVKIIETAVQQIYDRGLHLTTPTSIAADLNLKQSHVYYYFASIKELHGAVVRYSLEHNRAKLLKKMGVSLQTRGIDTLLAYFAYNLEWADQYPEVFCSMVSSLANSSCDSEAAALMKSAMETGRQRIYHFLTQGLAEGEIQLVKAGEDIGALAYTLHNALTAEMQLRYLYSDRTKKTRSVNAARLTNLLSKYISIVESV